MTTTNTIADAHPQTWAGEVIECPRCGLRLDAEQERMSNGWPTCPSCERDELQTDNQRLRDALATIENLAEDGSTENLLFNMETIRLLAAGGPDQ